MSAEDRLPFEAELVTRIGWLIRLRWIAVLGTAAAIGLATIWFPLAVATGSLLVVTSAIALYNLLFLLFVRRLQEGRPRKVRFRHSNRLAYGQIVLDLLALAALIHFSGGVENPMSFFFVFHVIIASILLRRAVSYLMAGLALLFLGAVAGLESAGAVAHYHLPFVPGEPYREPWYLLIFFVALGSALFLAAYLTTSISARLRERDRELVDSNLTCQSRSQELAELNDELRRLDAERTRFLVMVTHELRAPIATIYSALDLAQSGYAPPEKVQHVLGRAQGRAAELLDLIRDLLDLTKARQQATETQAEVRVQLEDVLRDVVEFMRVEAEEKGIILEVSVAPGLPPVRAEPDRAKVLWTNLLSNALKYTESGGRVVVRLHQDQQQIIGEVRDTGIGIAQEDQPLVFEEFFRAGNARAVSPHGSGVGLATVRRLIEHWGGRIWLESVLGEGSVFRFTLPAAK